MLREVEPLEPNVGMPRVVGGGEVDWWRVWRGVTSENARRYLREGASQRYRNRREVLRVLGIKQAGPTLRYWRAHYAGFRELDEELWDDPRFAMKFFATLALPGALLDVAEVVGDPGESREKRLSAAREIMAAAGEGGEVDIAGRKKRGPKPKSEWGKYLK